MHINTLTPKQSLNKTYLKEKVTRSNIELFKNNLIHFIERINEKESEEYVKNLVTKFLYDTYYNGKNQINTKGRIDLAIYEGRKQGSYKWFEVQDSIEYAEEFEKLKIVWPETALDNQFCYVDAGIYLNKTSFFIPIKDDFLLGLLNSSLAKFYFGSIVSKMRGGYFSVLKAYVETFPVSYNKRISNEIAKLVGEIISKGNRSSSIEVKIDKLVYQLYRLTEEEIKIIEEII